MNHGQSTSSVVTTRTESIHGLTYSVARMIEVTTWQSVHAIIIILDGINKYAKTERELSSQEAVPHSSLAIKLPSSMDLH